MGDNHVFSVSPDMFFRPANNIVITSGLKVPSCSLAVKSNKNDLDKPKKRRFLIGNILLKNYYVVYDYDLQEIKLGVNIHSKGKAFIKKFKPNHTWSSDNGYVHID